MNAYLIFMGGTGARCAEAFIHLAAGGYMDTGKHYHILLIDPDNGNGNVNRFLNAYNAYTKIHNSIEAKPPSNQFRAQISCYVWNLGIESGTTVRNFLHIDARNYDPEFTDFLNLYVEDKDLDSRLDVGFLGRPNIGAVVTEYAFRRELSERRDDSSLVKFIRVINADISNDEVNKICVFGSIFGGTGASSIPLIPDFIRRGILKLNDHKPGFAIPQAAWGKMHFMANILAPYFKTGGETPEFDQRAQIALATYRDNKMLDQFKAVSIIGSQHRKQTNQEYVDGAASQMNAHTPIELFSVLVAIDFIDRNIIPDPQKKFYVSKRNDERSITWNDVPVCLDGDGANVPLRINRLKLCLVEGFATHLLVQYIFDNYADIRDKMKLSWFRNDIGQWDKNSEIFSALRDYFYAVSECKESYMNWVRELHTPGDGLQLSLIAVDGTARNSLIGLDPDIRLKGKEEISKMIIKMTTISANKGLTGKKGMHNLPYLIFKAVDEYVKGFLKN
ncbi:MAG: hypothetical protein PHV91_01260 [Bacteroidales bacterium]|nr:hypothetical protein [Candidatus Cloacimonadota bacterium]MCB5269260.1 hypothetical protein [Candidatus Cloacimonadota bacterium]MDD3299448.1 hypothetical protein [Bacteroidales bacterium]